MVEIKIPSPGESISEVTLVKWFVSDGQKVDKNQELAELESDKATLTLTASSSGIIHLLIKQGETVNVGQVACRIDETSNSSEEEVLSEPEKSIPLVVNQSNEKTQDVIKITPLARKIIEVEGISESSVVENLTRITSKDVLKIKNSDDYPSKTKIERTIKKEPISALRKKLSQRLVQVKNQTAMLTTFNEVDMSRVIEIRNKYKIEFEKKYGIKLGFMSFFAKAASIALQNFPNINAMIDGDEIVRFSYTDIGIAVQTPKGLMVPVFRDIQEKSLAEIEAEIARLAQKARDSKISLDELSGGTFSITNGGVFGSLFSTPIINPPQAAILGMHAIQDRPVVRENQIVIRPMMYLALSYDHRLVDGKDSVSFLVKIKEIIENPELFLTGGKELGNKLLFE
jgi:2-oxoglutarate dehydrogenase E2 component (dihydrolipoamide succinyltransferase)